MEMESNSELHAHEDECQQISIGLLVPDWFNCVTFFQSIKQSTQIVKLIEQLGRVLLVGPSQPDQSTRRENFSTNQHYPIKLVPRVFPPLLFSMEKALGMK